jgi:hypothetical protein
MLPDASTTQMMSTFGGFSGIVATLTPQSSMPPTLTGPTIVVAPVPALPEFPAGISVAFPNLLSPSSEREPEPERDAPESESAAHPAHTSKHAIRHHLPALLDRNTQPA